MGTKTLQSLLDAIRRALEMERTQPEAAVLALRGVLSEALRQGVDSAYLRYVLAQALEQHGELEMAFDEIKKAMKLDPLALPIRHAFQELAGRIRASLAHPDAGGGRPRGAAAVRVAPRGGRGRRLGASGNGALRAGDRKAGRWRGRGWRQ